MTVIYSQGTPDLTATFPPRATTLMEMAQEILARVRQLAVQMGLTLPTRQFVHLAAVPVDCEQVAVLIGGWTPQPAWSGLEACQNFRWCGQFAVLVSRCTPAIPNNRGDPPTVEKMNRAAVIASDDAELLLQLVGGLGEVGGDLLLNTPEAEGGFQTTVLNVTVPQFGGL